MKSASSPVAPAAWARVFASTLVRLYPTTAQRVAAKIAHDRYPVDGTFDPVSAAEHYALSEGRPASG